MDDEPIWPGQADILGSDLFAMIRGSEDPERLLHALMSLVLRYAFSECLFLACALARHAGEPVTVLRYTIAVPDDSERLLHAVLVRGPLESDAQGFDILGARPVSAALAGMTGFGPVVLRPLPQREWITPDDFLGDQAEVALTVAGCLPWLSRFVPARYRIDPRYALHCLIDTVARDSFARYRHQETHHGP